MMYSCLMKHLVGAALGERGAIGIRKRRHLTPEALVVLERARASIKTPFRGDSVRQNGKRGGVMEGPK
jgi:hypothetical protein